MGNTFVPLFECLGYLHARKLVHGEISLENIVLIDGEIKIRDWLVRVEVNPYYKNRKEETKTEIDDIMALGQILMQFATLRKSSNIFEEKDVDLALESIIDVYGKNIIFALAILMKKRT